jgi:hypothetical protein
VLDPWLLVPVDLGLEWEGVPVALQLDAWPHALQHQPAALAYGRGCAVRGFLLRRLVRGGAALVGVGGAAGPAAAAAVPAGTAGQRSAGGWQQGGALWPAMRQEALDVLRSAEGGPQQEGLAAGESQARHVRSVRLSAQASMQTACMHAHSRRWRLHSARCCTHSLPTPYMCCLFVGASPSWPQSHT